jgi:hypothetical protein
MKIPRGLTNLDLGEKKFSPFFIISLNFYDLVLLRGLRPRDWIISRNIKVPLATGAPPVTSL